MTTSSSLTKQDIYHSDRYYANPDNKHHFIYQRGVDRKFAFAMTAFVLTWVVVLHGWQSALALVLGCLGSYASLLFIAKVVIPLGSDILHWFLDWLDGY